MSNQGFAMQVNHSSALPIGLPENGPPKLKSTHNFIDSSSNTNCNTHTSLSQSTGNNGRNMSPYSPFPTDSQSEDLVLAKNGSSNCGIGQNNSPFASNESSPVPVACGSPSIANAVASARPTSGSTTYAKREGIKITIRPNKPDSRIFNNYSNTSSPGDVKGSSASSPRGTTGIRAETPAALHNDKTHNSALVRSLSANNSANLSSSRRLHDSMSLSQARSNSPRAALNSTKFADKNSLRGSPLTDYVPSETRVRNETDLSCASPTSENTLPSSKGKSPVVGDSASSTANTAVASATGIQRSSRTSSNNSVSDLSPCSVIIEENGAASTPHASISNEAVTSNAAGSAKCNIETSSSNDLNMGNSLLTTFGDIDPIQSEKIRLSLEQAGNFDFPDSGSGSGDIGSHALKLSAEDIQRTLNSVSAESELPGISLSEMSHKADIITSVQETTSTLQTDILDPVSKNKIDLSIVSNAKDGRRFLPSVVSMTTPTSSTASVMPATASPPSTDTNSTSKTTTSSMTTPVTSPSHTSEAFHTTCAALGQPSSTSVSYSPANVSAVSTKSHLQEILGETDTNRLKNMARPVDSAQYPAPSPTSFSKSGKSNPYLSRVPSLDRPGGLMTSDTLPSNSIPAMTPRHRFPGNSFPRHPLHHRPQNPTHPMPGPPHHGYEHPGLPLDRTSSFVDVGPRPGIHFDPTRLSPSHRPMQGGNNISHNLSSSSLSLPGGPLPWQRASSMGDVMSPNNPMHGMGDVSKGPRPQVGSNFPHRSINPMSGLQSTVNSIPNMGSMMKGNNMGPPHLGSGGHTPTSQQDFLSDSRMLPPQSPSVHDKRSMTTDGTNSTKKGGKRERGQSLDSKDGDKKDTGPKSKRRKSKSKEESKKADSRSNCRPGVLPEPQGNSYLYVFNTEIANKAAEVVSERGASSIIAHHGRYQGNSRLLPSKLHSFPNNQNNNFGLKSPGPVVKSEGIRPDTKPALLSPLPDVSAIMGGPNQTVKLEAGGGAPSSAVQVKTQDAEMANILTTIKSEADSQVDASAAVVTQASSPTTAQVKTEEDQSLTDAQRKHREQSLEKINNLRARFLPDSSQPLPSSSASASWKNHATSAGKTGHYAMSQHLTKAYNEERRRNKSLHSNNPDTLSMEGVPLDPPPPYTGHPAHTHQRWMVPGHPIREPGRYPHMGLRGQMRLPHDGARFPAGYPHSRFPHGYVGPPGRTPIYGPNVPPAGLMLRGSVPRLSQPHNMGSSNEVYPFSEKLKEQASMYRSEGVHNQMYRSEGIHPHQAVPAGFDMNNPAEGGIGPRMGSPEWSHYGNPPGSMPVGGRITPVSHPSMGDPGSMIPNPAPMPQGVIDPSIETNSAMRMNNPGMNPSYPMTSFCGKGPGNLANYQDSPVPGVSPLVPSFPPQDMQPTSSNMSGMMPNDAPVQGGLMGDAMARRGEPRPPDLNINPVLSRSPPPFHGGRHPPPSPSIVPNPVMPHPQYLPGNVGPGSLPHASPHPSVVPHSPMVNSPSMIKSPMGPPMSGQVPYMPIGQPGPMQPMEQGGAHPGGPPSVDPGTPGDWNSMPQQNMGQTARTPSSGAVPPNPGGKSAISRMIDRVNQFELPSALYQNEVKDTSSPPPLTHMNGSNGIPQEPPPLTHPAPMDPSTMQGGVANPGMIVRSHQPVYDTGSRSAGLRPMASMIGEGGFPSDFNRPLSHPTMCMSPGAIPGANMMQPGFVDMPGPSAGYMPQSNMMPMSTNPGMGGTGPPVPSANHPPNSRVIPEFDLTGMIPSEKPSQTLSYFPSGAGSAPDAGQMDDNPPIAMRSPPMFPQQPMSRFPNISRRPLTPGTAPYGGNNPGMRLPVPGSFMPSNPPSYPGHSNEGGYSMSPAWDGIGRGGMVRGQIAPNNDPGVPMGYMGARTMM